MDGHRISISSHDLPYHSAAALADSRPEVPEDIRSPGDSAVTSGLTPLPPTTSSPPSRLQCKT
ncbi:hypothetical protein J6590_015191 [Homalodisca vitripennis]|nr:hypothetical protein J6590_015191 [Homalodisca vitripennis]